jgi:integrase
MSQHVSTIDTQSLKGKMDIIYNRRVCAALARGTKNLAAAEQKETVAGEIGKTFDKATAKGLLLQYELWLQKEGYGENCRYVSCIRMLINSETNLLNPDDVKATIAKKKWKNGTKMQATYAYDALARMLKITWSMPTYKQEEILPFIPDEKELDALICGARSRRLAAYLQTLKETFADPSEALRLRWIDITENIVTINRPVKNHNPRQLQVSNKLLAMLNALPKDSELIFPTTYNNMALCFYKVRRKIAQTQQNPRIMNISLGTFRHWGATMVYHQTRDILLVKKLLGHKKIENTMKYTQLIQFKDDEYDVATASTVEEAKSLLAAGFEEQPVPINGVVLFRKPKRFNC